MTSLSRISRSKKPLPALIIGAGLGGLNLAHSLRSHGIPYRIFERDAATSDRVQSHRISLDEGGASALKGYLQSSKKGAGELSPEELALKLTDGWHPSIRTIMDNQTPSQTAALRLTSSSTTGTAVWETNKRVTILGNAVHCMPPTGGQGANAALHDAALLGLVSGKAKDEGEGEEEGWSEGTIGAYEDGMRRYIGDVVGMACIGAKRIFGATVPT